MKHNHTNMDEYHPACGGCQSDPSRMSLPTAAHYSGYVNIMRDPQTDMTWGVTGIGVNSADERVGLRIDVKDGPDANRGIDVVMTCHAAYLMAQNLLAATGVSLPDLEESRDKLKRLKEWLDEEFDLIEAD